MGGSINLNPIQILVNYWELKPSLMGARLNELLRRGVNHVVTFVPWQAVEADISHTLPRFLQALAERKITVSLILTPEVGVHYANSGLPRDLFSRHGNPTTENLAKDAQGSAIPVGLPPNHFELPSLYSQDFIKRYQNFLSRMDTLLADLGRNQPSMTEGVRVILTGCFWKYYRSAKESSVQAFGGLAGDFSGHAGVSYRQRIEQYYSQPEFADPNPMAANRWKVRGLEDANRKWFYQHSEDVFRNRSSQFVRRRALSVEAEQIELYTPEADPALHYSSFLQTLTGGKADFQKLSKYLDDAASRTSSAGDTAAAPYIHWTGFGGFRTLSDPEKQFLIFKSLLLMGGQGGGLLIDDDEWFSLSEGFRVRAEGLARLIGHGDLQFRAEALYLTSHLWSGGGAVWNELQQKAGPKAKMIASLDRVSKDRDSRLLIVDPTYPFTREVLQRLVSWARSGRVVALPRNSLYTEMAKSELDALVATSGAKMEISLGVSYHVHALGEGKLVLFDVPAEANWQMFVSAMMAVANVYRELNISDTRLQAIPLLRRDGGQGLFVMNATGAPVAADLIFETEVCISDLASSFARAPGKSASVADPSTDSAPVPAERFALEVPPCGVLPLAVDGLGERLVEERIAAMTDGAVAEHVLTSALGELPGFDPDEDLRAKWS